jgi:hypothetical protein
MDKTIKPERRICPKCGKAMNTKRTDAKQCKFCRRKQQSSAGNEINKSRRESIKREKQNEIERISHAKMLAEIEDCSDLEEKEESFYDTFFKQNPKKAITFQESMEFVYPHLKKMRLENKRERIQPYIEAVEKRMNKEKKEEFEPPKQITNLYGKSFSDSTSS